MLFRSQIFIKVSKSIFVQEELEYLGHIISVKGVQLDQRKIEAMVDWPLPKDVSALRGFTGLTGYYKIFVKGYGCQTTHGNVEERRVRMDQGGQENI